MNEERHGHGHGRRGRRKRPMDEPARPEDKGKNPNKQPKKAAPGSDAATVGCPMFFHDPLAYYDCILTGFTRPADITQHMRRVHILKSYCADCFHEFESDNLRDAHSRLRLCIQRDHPPPNTVLNSMLDNMPRTGSLEDKWYYLWNTLFPNQEPPQSPFIYNDCRDVFRVVHQLNRNFSGTGFSALSGLGDRLNTLEALCQTGTAVPGLQLPMSLLGQSAAMQPDVFASSSLASEGNEGPMMSGTDADAEIPFSFYDFINEDNGPSTQ